MENVKVFNKTSPDHVENVFRNGLNKKKENKEN